MAERVDKIPPRPGQGRYDWESWLDGSVWKIDLAADCPGVSLPSFRSSLSSHARRYGLKYKTRFVGGYLYVQAHRGDRP